MVNHKLVCIMVNMWNNIVSESLYMVKFLDLWSIYRTTELWGYQPGTAGHHLAMAGFGETIAWIPQIYLCEFPPSRGRFIWRDLSRRPWICLM